MSYNHQTDTVFQIREITTKDKLIIKSKRRSGLLLLLLYLPAVEGDEQLTGM